MSVNEEASKGKPRAVPSRHAWPAMAALVVGAGGSVGLMLRVGHRNSSRFLLLLFGIWVVAPFVALAFADAASKRWPVLTRAPLDSLILVVTLGSLAIYGIVAFGPPMAKPAFPFLVVPLASWLGLAVVIGVAAFPTRRY